MKELLEKSNGKRSDALRNEPDECSSKREDSGRGRSYLEFIGYLQVIGIILVVLGHSFHEYPDGGHGNSLLIYRLCYSFHMPLFIFISGFLLIYPMKKRGYEISVRKFTVKKLKRLFIPYAVLTLITFLPRAAMSGMADDPMPVSAVAMFRSLYLTELLPIPFFWFLQADLLLLIFSYIVLAAGRRLNIPDIISLGILLLCIVLARFPDWGTTEIFGYRSAIKFGVYFIAGALFSLYYERINSFLPLDNALSLIVSVSSWLTVFFLAEGTNWAYITGICGIIMAICVAKLLVRYNVRVLDHLKGANYLIFLLSWYMNVLTQQILAHFIILPWWVHTILSLLFGIYIPWLFYIYLRDNQHRRGVRIISLLLGQTFGKR